jgi:hypothetical protein
MSIGRRDRQRHVAFLQYANAAPLHAWPMAEPKNYLGSCHCGAVRYEVTMAEPDKAYACNCSICSRAGWLLGFVARDAMRITSGQDSLTDYQFGKKKLHHFFCRTCGVRCFSFGQLGDGTESAAVNLRCLEGLTATSLPVEHFDGASI